MARDLNWSPRHNWVEDCGGLGDLANVVCHMLERGVPREKGIPAAINFAKHVCATDQSKNFTISNPTHHVAGWKQARWCAAAGHWEKLKACAHARHGAGKAVDGAEDLDRRGQILAEIAHLDTQVEEWGDRDWSDYITVEQPAGKALERASFKAMLSDDAAVEQLDNGDLLIRGLAADFGLDRDDEAFEPGAFERGIKAFLDSNPLLAYHHDPSRALGTVRKLWRDEKGVHMEAVIKQPADETGWAHDVYQKVRAGVIRGLSVGGKFRRRVTAAGPRIFDVDLQEISVTPLPVNPRTLFQVAAEGKAMDGEPLRWEPDEADLGVADAVSRLERVFAELDGAIS